MIGVFDSGVGGLSVVKHLINRFNADIVYLGDSARLPYGSKSKDTIIKYSINNVRFLMSLGVDMVVVACNTASSFAIETLKATFKIPIFGVVEPASKVASKYNNVCVIGTEATIKSDAYVKNIKNFNKNVNVFQRACPLFVPLVEEGWIDKPVTFEIAKEYLNDINCDALILGCTHYPLLKKVIHSIVPNVKLIDSGEALVSDLDKFYDIIHGESLLSFYTTDSKDKFEKIGRLFLGMNFNGVKLVDI